MGKPQMSKGEQKSPLNLLPNQTWVHSPMCSKANLLTPNCGEGKYRFYCRAPSKKGQLMLKRPELPSGFQAKGFKGSVREGAAGCMIKVKFQASSTFWFQPV